MNNRTSLGISSIIRVIYILGACFQILTLYQTRKTVFYTLFQTKLQKAIPYFRQDEIRSATQPFFLIFYSEFAKWRSIKSYESDDPWKWRSMKVTIHESDDSRKWRSMKVTIHESNDPWKWRSMKVTIHESDDPWKWRSTKVTIHAIHESTWRSMKVTIHESDNPRQKCWWKLRKTVI